MADKESCFWCGKESIMTLTLDGVRRRACNDCGRKWAVESGKAGSDIGVSVGGKLFSYHPSKELMAEVREKAKSGRLMCAYCSHRIAEADLAGFRVYIPHDMKSRHTYTLCPACEAKVVAGDKGILEDVEEKIESGKYVLGEEAGDYELMGEPIHVNLPTEKQWAICFTHEGGETSVSYEKGMIIVRTYEQCQKFIANWRPEGIQARCRAVARSEYDPKKYDTYHLRLGSSFDKAEYAAQTVADRLGLLVEEYNVGSVLDVLTRLKNTVSETPKVRLSEEPKGRQVLGMAHPFVWKPSMVAISNDAVRQLKEPIRVTPDLLPLNPSIWLYNKLNYVVKPARECIFPETHDGHIPWPDEETFDGGLFEVASILSLNETELNCCHVILERSDEFESGWGIRFYEFPLKIGSIPEEDFQPVLKLLLFLQSPYLAWRAEKPQRSFVRRAEGQFPTAEKRINVVLLRRMVELRKEKRGEGYEPAEWSCQWWVSSHWRRQWHPSTKTHKPTWIAPYIKGPPDKPLKDTVRLIVR